MLRILSFVGLLGLCIYLITQTITVYITDEKIDIYTLAILLILCLLIGFVIWIQRAIIKRDPHRLRSSIDIPLNGYRELDFWSNLPDMLSYYGYIVDIKTIQGSYVACRTPINLLTLGDLYEIEYHGQQISITAQPLIGLPYSLSSTKKERELHLQIIARLIHDQLSIQP